MSLASSPLQLRRLPRGRFALAALAVYLVSFVSQMLLSAPVTALVSVFPFVVLQAVLIWLWIEIHRRRLRDAGRPTGVVVGIACVYAIEVVLLALLVWVLISSNSSSAASSGADIFHLFVILYLLGSMSGDAGLGAMQAWLFGFVVIMLLPVAIAICFSLWAGTRPSAASAP